MCCIIISREVFWEIKKKTAQSDNTNHYGSDRGLISRVIANSLIVTILVKFNFMFNTADFIVSHFSVAKWIIFQPMCINKQVGSFRITLLQSKLYRIETCII